ncbi:MAG TPA: permease-like cell division protein FtsX [Nitrospira sp.]|nr:ABC transporter permease [Nitrospira sp.]MBX3371831.1 ABC transporter permease [Nitrospira sp.]MBX7038959.1 ABC transporter permease [Nitrospira sp.]MCW5795637.1 ABC transporter permease [Nitrospira sp.]HMU30088.1 permease-like cell division protein FtsX [Nitrospira sp.]
MRRLLYLLREAVANVLTNRTTTLVAVATTAFTFACVGVFLLLYVNLRTMASSLEQDIQVMVYLQDDLTEQARSEIEQQLKIDRAIASLTFVSKERALADFQAQFPSESRLLQGLGQNPLPASFVVLMAPESRSSDAMRRWANRTQLIPGVSQVQYNQEWVEALAGIVRYIEVAAIIVGVILSAASVTIIANTIRLALYSRREEIEILGLIGASTTFIRVPYLLEGAALGLCGSALSLVILKGGFELFRHQIHSATRFLGVDALLTFFSFDMCLVLMLVGLFLGCAGSFLSLLRFGEGRA